MTTAQEEKLEYAISTPREITRQELKDLIDCVPTDELIVVKRFIQYVVDMQDPVLRSLLEAPVDDEPTSESDVAMLQEAREDIAAGRLTPAKELYRELGI